MFPILFTFPHWLPLIGDKSIHTYGLMVALGFLAGLQWVKYESNRLGMHTERLMDLFFYIVLSAIIGSRLYYVFFFIENWWQDPLVLIRFWEGGLVFYGGLIGALITSFFYMRRHSLPFLAVSDVFVPGIALGHAIGRLGCFAAGCCYGREAPANSFFGITFPKIPFSIAPTNHPIYPSQLFESGTLLILFFILMTFRKRKKFTGEVFLIYLILYPLARIFLETFREDEVRGVIYAGIISQAQILSLIWITIACTIWVVVSRKKRLN